MTTKLEQAALQALDALEELFHSNSTKVAVEKYNTAHTALREALDHSGEANEMVVGWDRVKPEAIASDLLYQQGFVDGVEEGRNQVIEQAGQEPLLWGDDKFAPHERPQKLEPVAWMNEINGFICKEKTRSYHVPLYTHPVRTKDPCNPLQDLTDDEIRKISSAIANTMPANMTIEDWKRSFARAVIAADRKKNK